MRAFSWVWRCVRRVANPGGVRCSGVLGSYALVLVVALFGAGALTLGLRGEVAAADPSVSVVGTATGTIGFDTSVSATLPPGIQAGDTILLLFGLNFGSSSALVATSGYDLLTDSGDVGGVRSAIFRKLATGSESGTTVSVSTPYTGAHGMTLRVLVLRGLGSFDSGYAAQRTGGITTTYPVSGLSPDDQQGRYFVATSAHTATTANWSQSSGPVTLTRESQINNGNPSPFLFASWTGAGVSGSPNGDYVFQTNDGRAASFALAEFETAPAGSGAVSVVGTATGTIGFDTSVSATLPAGIQAGDTILLLFGLNFGSSSTLVPTSGYDLLTDSGDVGGVRSAIFRKPATGSESGTTVSVSTPYTGGHGMTLRVLVLRGLGGFDSGYAAQRTGGTTTTYPVSGLTPDEQQGRYFVATSAHTAYANNWSQSSGPVALTRESQIINGNPSPFLFASWTGAGVSGSPNGDYVFQTNDGRAASFALAEFETLPVGSLVGGTVEQTFGPNVCRRGRGIHARSASHCSPNAPVNTLTGAFSYSESDLSLPGVGVPFEFTRSYTSADPTTGRLGLGWADSYSAFLSVLPSGNVILHGEDGQQVTYTKQPDGSHVGAVGATSTLTLAAGVYQLLTHDQVSYQFNSSGVLQSMRDRNNQGLTFAYTGGQLTGITDAVNRTIILGYNGSLLSSVSVPDGRTVTYGYTNGRLTSATLPDPDGSGPLPAPVTSYTYLNGRLATVVDPNGHTVYSNVYDPTSARVTTLTDANDTTNKTTRYLWDPATQTATITDARDNVWKDIYQNNALLKTIDATGKTTLFGHIDGALNLTSVTSPNGTDTTTMSYENGNLKTITAPASLGSVQKLFTYSALNDVETVTDALGHVTRYGYLAGNNTSITLDDVPVASFTYKPNGQLETSTDGNGKTSTYGYDANGNVASVTAPDPDGTGPLEAPKTTYTYYDSGFVHTMVAPRGNCTGCNAADYTTSYTYDSDGRLLTETDPLNHTTSHSYDPAGNETSVTDANGHTTSHEYNDADQLVKTTGPDPDGSGPLEAPITTYTYDAVGNRLTMVDPRGNCTTCDPAAHTTTYTYDPNNRLASVTTPKGEKTTYTYDPDGNLASVVDPRGNVPNGDPNVYKTSYVYDAAGRLLTTTDPLSHVTTNHYEPVGNLEWTKDANQHQTSYSYYATGRVHTVTGPDPDGTGPLIAPVTSYTYDGNNNVKTRTDANNHTTGYGYDDAGRLSTLTGPDPDGNGPLPAPLTTYSYDADGNLASKTDPNGNATQTAGDGTISYTYDRADRLTGIDYSDTTPDVTFGYDNVGNRTSMTDGLGSVSYGYDNLDRLTNTTRGTDTFAYTYDPASNLTSRAYPDNTATSYGYDEDNRLASAASGGASTGYGYDPAGHLTQTTLPADDGYVETRSYDRAGRLNDVQNANGANILSEYVAVLDPVGNPTQISQAGAVSSTTNYGYDQLDRLTSVCFQAGSCPGASDPFIRWSYDPVGNRLTQARPTNTTTYTYNAADEMAQAVTQVPGSNPYASRVQTDGAQPYWRFGETSGGTFASTVGTYTGNWSNSPTLGVTGALNGDENTAVTLNGTSQYGTMADSNQLDKSNNFTVELWVKRTGNALSQAIVGKPLTTTTKSENYAFWLDTTNKIRFEVGSGNKSATVTSPSALDTSWHHVVGTFASGTLKLYVDGALSATATATFTAAAANASQLQLGRAGTTNYYRGSLDELAVYGTALTPAQVSDHYIKGTTPPPPQSSTTNYTYDANGRQASAGPNPNPPNPLTWNVAGQLTQALTSDNLWANFSYDGDGNRSSATVGSTTTNYLWDTNNDLAQLALERDGSSNLLRRYTYGARRISMTSGGNNFYYHYDTLGSVTNLTTSGASEWTYSYEPYGSSRMATKNDSNAPANPMQFTGEYLDPTGLYNLRARLFDPPSGRFTAPDPVATPTGNPYASSYVYATDRPTFLVDPTGMTSVPSDMAVASARYATSSVAAQTTGYDSSEGPDRNLSTLAADRCRASFSFTTGGYDQTQLTCVETLTNAQSRSLLIPTLESRGLGIAVGKLVSDILKEFVGEELAFTASALRTATAKLIELAVIDSRRRDPGLRDWVRRGGTIRIKTTHTFVLPPGSGWQIHKAVARIGRWYFE